jgi:peptidylprolyl isomerase
MVYHMRTLTIGLLLSSVALSSACHSDHDNDSPAPSAAHRLIEQVAPPLDLKTPPADATKTASGVVYTRLAANAAGMQPKSGDMAMIHYTGWRQNSGETFFTTKGRGQPIAVDVAHAAPGFREALPLLHKGERAVMWMPPGHGAAETLVYEVEVVDIVSPPVVANRTPAAGASQGAPAH